MSCYVAAWLAPSSLELLKNAGVTKIPHMTTFFDGYGTLPACKPYPWHGRQQAEIVAVSLWQVGAVQYLVAEMRCDWSAAIHAHYVNQGARQDMPHRPHITLKKCANIDDAIAFQKLVGIVIEFDRHGPEEESISTLFRRPH